MKNMQEENEVMQLAEEAAVDENWLRDFKTGIAMGLCLSSQFESKAEPIAYLYGHVAKEGETPTHTINGVDYVGWIGPKLPNWDESVYRYAELEADTSGNHYLIVLTAPSIRDGNSYKYTEDGIYNGYQVSDGIWVSYGEGIYKKGETHNPDADFGDRIFWSNYDILYEDKKVHLAASNPIPVYE